MVLNCLNNVTLSVGLKDFLGNENVHIVEWYLEVEEISSTLLKGSWMSEGSLVVWNWPLWGGNHSQVMVQVWVD